MYDRQFRLDTFALLSNAFRSLEILAKATEDARMFIQLFPSIHSYCTVMALQPRNEAHSKQHNG